MRPNCSTQRRQALTLIELLVIIAVIVLLALTISAPSGEAKRKAKSISCLNNLKQINEAFREWEADNNDKYPMQISVTNGGAMELVATGNVMSIYLAMSNALSTPKILHCPDDFKRKPAVDFGPSFTESNISYFVGVDANQFYPQRILSGDDHLQMNGIPTRAGLLELSTNLDAGWTLERHAKHTIFFWMLDWHRKIGNIGFADGSVEQLDTDALRQALGQTGMATNRLVMP